MHQPGSWFVRLESHSEPTAAIDCRGVSASGVVEVQRGRGVVGARALAEDYRKVSMSPRPIQEDNAHQKSREREDGLDEEVEECHRPAG